MLNERVFKVEKINVNLLHSGLVYQRKVTDIDRVKNIAGNWTDALFEYPCVSFRDGVYNVIDGQHTIASFKMRNGQNSEIQCKVGYELTEQEENEWFDRQNSKTKKQAIKAMYNSKMNGQHDKELNALLEDLKQCNLLLAIDISGGNRVIRCLKSMIDIHKSMNSIDFITCFKLLESTWHGQKNSLKDIYIKGLVKFYNTYKGLFNEDRFVHSLSKVDPIIIKNQVNNDMSKLKLDIKYARAFVNHYNFKIRKFKPLKISKLED